MCETVMAPAPMAKTAKALSVIEIKPKVSNKGAIMAEVVIIATVEEPWAVLSTAAITKAIKSPPTPVLDSKLMIEAISMVRRMAPKAPPAPVINTPFTATGGAIRSPEDRLKTGTIVISRASRAALDAKGKTRLVDMIKEGLTKSSG